MRPAIASPLLFAFIGIASATLLPRDSTVVRSGTATVSLAAPTGTASYLAAAVHNGIPPNDFSAYVSGTPAASAAVQTQIPDAYLADIKLNNARGGQGNLPEPSRGWMYGLEEYQNRFQAVHSNYLTLRELNATYTLMISNLWGQLNSSSTFPGDDEDWTSWDEFIVALCSDVIANDMTEGLNVEIWNEPDIQFSSRTQWLDVYGRTFHQLRDNLPSSIKVVGPGYADPPDNYNWWTSWLDLVAGNGSFPDIMTYHHLRGGTDPAVNYVTLLDLLDERDLEPSVPIDVNEFGAPSEQTPSFDVWFIARLERLGLRGFRANWESTAETTADYLANTLAKDEETGEYSANGSWRVLRYYAGMEGERLATTGSDDGNFEAFAVSTAPTGPGSTKVITGSHGTTNPYLLLVTGLSERGYSSKGTLSVHVSEFRWNGLYGAVGQPASLGTVEVEIVDDTFSIGTTSSNEDVAYAFEF